MSITIISVSDLRKNINAILYRLAQPMFITRCWMSSRICGMHAIPRSYLKRRKLGKPATAEKLYFWETFWRSMVYSVHLAHQAEKQLDDLPPAGRYDVLTALQQLAETPRTRGCKWTRELHSWRMRVGDYRVLYDIDDDPCEVTVFRIQDRKDVYKKR